MSTTQELIVAMEKTWRQLTVFANDKPQYLITDSLRRARKVRYWRGKKFVFRGLHDALVGIVP